MYDVVRRMDNCNIIRGIVNTFLNGWHIMYGVGTRMESQFQPYGKVNHRDVDAVTWGCIGSILRGMWYLKDKVSEIEYNNS